MAAALDQLDARLGQCVEHHARAAVRTIRSCVPQTSSTGQAIAARSKGAEGNLGNRRAPTPAARRRARANRVARDASTIWRCAARGFENASGTRPRRVNAPARPPPDRMSSSPPHDRSALHEVEPPGHLEPRRRDRPPPVSGSSSLARRAAARPRRRASRRPRPRARRRPTRPRARRRSLELGRITPAASRVAWPNPGGRPLSPAARCGHSASSGRQVSAESPRRAGGRSPARGPRARARACGARPAACCARRAAPFASSPTRIGVI